MGLMQQFQQQPQMQGPTPLRQQLSDLKQMFDGNPQGLMSQLMRTNPQFAQFVAQNQGKTPQQAFKDNGLDFAEIQQLIQQS